MFLGGFDIPANFMAPKANNLGQLTTRSHEVAGEFTIMDDRTIHIKGFTYDGAGPGKRQPSCIGYEVAYIVSVHTHTRSRCTVADMSVCCMQLQLYHWTAVLYRCLQDNLEKRGQWKCFQTIWVLHSRWKVNAFSHHLGCSQHAGFFQLIAVAGVEILAVVDISTWTTQRPGLH